MGRSPARPLTGAGETEATCRWTFFPAYRAAPGEGRRLIGRRIAASTPAATPQPWPRAGRPDWAITTTAPCIVHSRVASPGGATHECTSRSNSGRWGGGPQGQNGKQPSNGLCRRGGRVGPEREWPACPTGRGKRVQCLPRGSLSDSRRPNEQSPNVSAPLEVSSRPCSATVPASQDEVGWAFVGGVECALCDTSEDDLEGGAARGPSPLLETETCRVRPYIKRITPPRSGTVTRRYPILEPPVDERMEPIGG